MVASSELCPAATYTSKFLKKTIEYCLQLLKDEHPVIEKDHAEPIRAASSLVPPPMEPAPFFQFIADQDHLFQHSWLIPASLDSSLRIPCALLCGEDFESCLGSDNFA